MRDKDDMQPEDIKRVESVINSGYNECERRPFSFLKIALGIYAIILLISLTALAIAHYHGVL